MWSGSLEPLAVAQQLKAEIWLDVLLYKVRHVARSLTGKCTVDMEKKFVLNTLSDGQPVYRCLRTGVMRILPGVLVTRRAA